MVRSRIRVGRLKRRMVEDRMSIQDPDLVANVVVPPEVVVVRDLDGFLEQGQPIEQALSDDDVQNVTPVDLFRSNAYTNKTARDARLDICKGCERLFKPTRTCRECGCFMGLKTWLKDASCPLEKW